MPADWTELHRRMRETDPVKVSGKVARVVGLTIESHGPPCAVGELCLIFFSRVRRPVRAEVVGFRDDRVLLMPLGDMAGIRPGSEVRPTGKSLSVPAGAGLLGRVVDGLGRPMDGKGPLAAVTSRPVTAPPPTPLERPRIRQVLATSVRSIDAFETWGRGQRLGLFAGSGVGKSTLLGMLARNSTARANVIALVGERGREVREFLERDLGPEGMARSIVVVATSEQPALVRVKAALASVAMAESLRDLGWDVVLMMDSLTRVALAQREVGLAAGEPPTTRGYTPSVFSLLPVLLERAGTAAKGSISGLYTVLVEGDDFNEPVSDAVRAILDGHIVLTRQLAQRGHYPPVDVLQSISRVMVDIVPDEHRQAAARLLELLAAHREAEDLIQIGAYRPGHSPRLDTAVRMKAALDEFLRQDMREASAYPETIARLHELDRRATGLIAEATRKADEALSLSAA